MKTIAWLLRPRRPVPAQPNPEPASHPAFSYVQPGEVDVLPGFDPMPANNGEAAEQLLMDAICADPDVAIYGDGRLYRRVGDDWAPVSLASIAAAYEKCWNVCSLSSRGKSWPTLAGLRAPFLPSLLIAANAVLVVDARSVTTRAYPRRWLHRLDFVNTCNAMPIDRHDVGEDGIYRPALRRDDPNDGILGQVRAMLFGLTLPGVPPAASGERNHVLYNRFRDAAHAEWVRRETEQLHQAMGDVLAVDEPEPAVRGRKRL